MLAAMATPETGRGGSDMLAALIRMIVQSLASAAANAGDTRAPGGGRAYYSGVITTMMFFPVAVFLFFTVVGVWSVMQGSDEGGLVVLLGLGGTVLMGLGMAHEFLKRTAVWTESGVKFHWLTGEADLKWSDIEKVEVRAMRGSHARIRFRDGRKFSVSPYLTGSRELLSELSQRGVAFYKWGTSKPVNLQIKA